MSENAYDTMRRAVAEAQETFRAADNAADSLAQLLAGRLHHVSSWTLAKLKKELRDFNSHTRKWKQR